jgi:hypothetical protein
MGKLGFPQLDGDPIARQLRNANAKRENDPSLVSQGHYWLYIRCSASRNVACQNGG